MKPHVLTAVSAGIGCAAVIAMGVLSYAGGTGDSAGVVSAPGAPIPAQTASLMPQEPMTTTPTATVRTGMSFRPEVTATPPAPPLD